ncbi:HAMP domain-containing histidine kinase [Joostella atrarenae]|uniref:histidine kinase n=1 Tax=Joostella atrarenae TaxID=679257 RepID=A0ABS9J0A6_9FLAO|nr:HAMP domain-containing sensor histidine kinase [Joostella atrarenae]MCF8713819.1 HAMP domain-containing histidine kinase [Joostella atrarenae]
MNLWFFTDDRDEITKLRFLALCVIISAFLFETYDELVLNGNFIKGCVDVLITLIILSLLVLNRFKVISLKVILTIVMYCILLFITFSAPIEGIHNLDSAITFFVKGELIFVLLIVGMGVLVDPLHINYCIALNLIFATFLVYYLFTIDLHIPTPKLFYYLVISSGSGIIAKRLYVHLLSLQSKLREANNDITLKNERLIRVNKSNQELFVILGHDMKTPFVHIRMLLDLMERADFSKDKFDKYKAMLDEATANGSKLLRNLLEWVHNNSLEHEMKITPFPLHSLVEEEIEMFKNTYISKEVKIVNLIPKDLIINADMNMSSVIIRNLLSNAIKYSHVNSKIEIGVRDINKSHHIYVKDFGVGVSEAVVEKIKKNIKVSSMPGTMNEQGTGLGINICKKLAYHHGGDITVAADDEVGSTFIFILPQ